MWTFLSLPVSASLAVPVVPDILGGREGTVGRISPLPVGNKAAVTGSDHCHPGSDFLHLGRHPGLKKEVVISCFNRYEECLKEV